MSFASVIAADSKAAHAEAGDAVVFVPASGDSIPTYAMSVGEPMQPRETDEKRTHRHKLVISLPKADVASVSTQGDRVTLPGSWVGSDEATVTWRVAEILKDRSGAGSWVLGMAK